jgi:hypothetical protein
VAGSTIVGTARGAPTLAAGAAAAYRTNAAASGEGGLKAAAASAGVAQAGIAAASDRIVTLFRGQHGRNQISIIGPTPTNDQAKTFLPPPGHANLNTTMRYAAG